MSRADREHFEQEQQQSGFPQFRIINFGAEDIFRPAGDRENYFPIQFTDPFEPEFVRLLGLDLATHPTLKSALHKAIDNGKVVASNPFDFIEGGRGYFIFKAIYRGHEIPTTMQERRKHVSAVIAFHLKADTFFSDILTQMPTYSVDVRNAATPPALNDNLIFSLSKTARQTSLDQLLPVVNLEYPLTGHASNFTARMSAFPDFISHLTWLSVILLITSVIGNASFICVLNNRRAALERAREDEALLRRSESRFRDFADSSSDWYWEMDRDLKFSRFSENLNDIVGVPPESLLGKTRGETGIPGIDPAVWKKHLEDLAAHRSFREFKHPRTLDNGEVLYLSINGKAIFDETGRFEGYRGTGSDITDRQKNELALQRANEDLEQRVAERTAELQESAAFKTEILDSALDCVISIDQEARVIEWNESAHHTFGYARNEAVGRMLVDLIVPPAMKDAHNAGFKRYIQTNEAKLIGQRIEITAMRANGDEFPIEMAISAQDRKDGKIITAYLRDLSEAKNAEERLQQAQKMEAVGQLTGGVAHDFNNLLGVILGNAEILSDTVGEDHPMPRAIIRAANRGAELTQRLLAFSRQQPLRPSSINLSKLVTDMLDLLKCTLGVTYNIKTIAPEDLWKASADPGQVENALLNLVINARDAMVGGGNLTIECSNIVLDDAYVLENPEAVTGAYVQLAVSDDGAGMSSDVQAHAFEPFFTTKDVGEGSGLGLSMIYGFAKQSNGHVAISSELGQGTTIKLYLPRTKEVAQPNDKPEASSLPQGAGETILIIEDDTDLRTLTVRMVKTLSYNVIDVPDAKSAYDIIHAGQMVDLVLSDIVLPGGVSGLEFADQIKVDFPALKIIFMSGYPDKAAKQNGVIGADVVFLNKPFQRRHLAEALQEALL